MSKILTVVFVCLVFSSFGSCTAKSTNLIDGAKIDTIKVNQSTIVLTDISANDYLALKKQLNHESLIQENKSMKKSKGQLIISLMNGKSLLLMDSLVSTDKPRPGGTEFFEVS